MFESLKEWLLLLRGKATLHIYLETLRWTCLPSKVETDLLVFEGAASAFVKTLKIQG